jgi:hypothetical protein
MLREEKISNMKIIINERQYRQIIESESNERLLEISVDEFLSAENVIFRNYKKKGYQGIRLVGNLTFYSNNWKDFYRLFEHVIEIDGNLDLINTNVMSLGNLESVSGYVDLRYCDSLIDLGKLKKVGGSLDLSKTKIDNLGNLEEVRIYLDVSESLIEDFGKLIKVGGHINLWGTKNFKSLGNLEEVGGYLYAADTQIKSLENLKTIGGYLDISNTEIKTLGSLEEVGGNLTIAWCQELDSFGKLKYVGAGISMRKTPLAKRMSESDIKNKIEVKGGIIK